MTCVVVTTTDNEAEAQKLASAAVDQRLAACVQIVGPIRSVYRWQGKIEEATEYRCEMKTETEKFERLKTMIQQMHSYDVPEIIAIPVSAISPEYQHWLDAELRD